MRTRTSLTVAAAAAALALGAVVPAAAATHPATASAILTTGSAGGAAVGVNDVLTGSLVSGTKATFYNSATSTTGVSCSQSAFSAKVLTNPAPTGSATESLTAQTFSGCTSNVTGVTGVQSLVVNGLPYNTKVSDSSGFPVTVTPGSSGVIQTTVTLSTLLGTATCVYTGPSINGNASNTDNSLNFVNQHFTKSSGSGLCFTDAYFSIHYGPVTDTTKGGAKVFTN